MVFFIARLRSVASFLFLSCALVSGACAQALVTEEIGVIATDEGWFASANFSLELSPVLEDALQRGLALPFVVEADLRRERWYWLDQQVATEALQYRLSYTPLTRRYRLGMGEEGGLALYFDRLHDALRAIGTVRSWRLGPPSLLKKGRTYSLAVRLRLDVEQLPKPFQLNAMTNHEWVIESSWLHRTLSP